MITANDGGQAFPIAYPESHSIKVSGMSLRDWFAGQALAGLLASGHFTLPNDKEENDGAWMTRHPDHYDNEEEKRFPARSVFDFPEAAWRCADSMLRYREEGEK
jgi:hypothetical protein